MADEQFDWHASPWENPEKLIQFYRDKRQARQPNDPSRWLLLIKELRVTHGCSILDAERIALAQPNWRRWVEQQINGNSECAKSARRHIHYNGDAALIEDRDGRLVVRYNTSC
jgi:hypothetical protein